MNIFEQIKSVMENHRNEMFLTRDIKAMVNKAFGTNPGSVIVSDYCYNRLNKGISFNKHLFEYITLGTYKYLGEGHSYTGLIYQKTRRNNEEEVVGEWIFGGKMLYDNAQIANREKKISKAQIEHLFEEYNRVLLTEMNLLKCAPTEVRHLIGRIGEFLCAMTTGGMLARQPNQHGFDVVADGRRISVKTTAQENGGFVTFNSNTIKDFDDVFIVHYKNGGFHILYNGAKEPIEAIGRPYNNQLEVDLNKIKKLSLQ